MGGLGGFGQDTGFRFVERGRGDVKGRADLCGGLG